MGEKAVAETTLGTLVRTRAYGIGRLVELDKSVARVRYFRGPSSNPFVDETHDASDISAVALSEHTRVYVNDGRRWRIGRIDGVHPQDAGKYLIAFPNGKGEILETHQFDVRWSVPIADPFEILNALGGDSPAVYEARLAILAEWWAQQSAAAGAEALLLGAVELHPHQLNVVRRVADDSVQRYLLADEVGLGKTIEAGALVRQFLTSNPTARVLVLTPDHLREQWNGELVRKFHLNEFASAWLRIRAHEDLPSWPDAPVDVLVVDEAHHLTRSGSASSEARARVVEIAHAAEKVLLLSATPVRSNEAAFLDLLYLLDPDHYDVDDIEAFTRRVELRDQLALTHQALVPDIDAFDIELYSEELTRLFPDDAQLADLLAEAMAATDAARPGCVSRLRTHLSETYRLHHRLLRTRRTSDLANSFNVRGRRRASPFTVDVPDSSAEFRRELLDGLRLSLAAGVEDEAITMADAVVVLKELGERCGALPDALLALTHEPGDASESRATQLTRALLAQNLLPDLGPAANELAKVRTGLMERATEALSETTLARAVGRIVVASGFTDTASAVARSFAERWGAHRVGLHLRTQTRDENARGVQRWLDDDDPCAVLFCDRGAEEGINLQRADLLVHLDLPWDAFRLEQRIGRCDRYAGAGAIPIPSAVVTYGEQTYALNWFEFLADGCGVFDRSVSSLQYALADVETGLLERSLLGGPDSLVNEIVDIASSLEAERVKITAHDALDSVEADEDEHTTDVGLVERDRDQRFARALQVWLEGVGWKARRDGHGVIELKAKPRPQVSSNLVFATRPWIDKPLALERSSAVERGLPILRAGHPVVDAIASQLRSDERGVAFAFFRPVRGHWPPTAVFRSDFLVTPSDTATYLRRADESGLGSWLRKTIETFMPPTVETVLLDDRGREVGHPGIRAPYDKGRGDQNLTSRPELFARLVSHLDWNALCGRALSAADLAVRSRPSTTERPVTASTRVRRAVLTRADRLRARREAGLVDVVDIDLDALLDALPNRLEQGIITLGCGVLFLGDPDAAAKA